MNRLTKIKITNLNPHVICVLCGGYYINATTIVECLHSFCRTCISRYLETSKYCPVCDVMVHKTRPLEYIRSDKTLQDLVYKLVPGLYKSEMKRRREYYAQHDQSGVPHPPSEDRGTEFHDRIIYTEDEKISLSLELCAEGIPFKTPSSVHGHNGPENIRISDVRYLSCPAAFSVGNLKKFIRMKFDLKLKYEIDIFHTAEPLPDYYTLMDIAYIYTWTRRAPLRLYYTVYECKIPKKIPDLICRDIERSLESGKTEKITVVEKQRVTSNCVKSKNDKNRKDKKRKYPDGPDDIVPDFHSDKSVVPNERKKETAGQRKRQKKTTLAAIDNSVMEAMSESEEQLAKLTLDCSNDLGTRAPIDTAGESSSDSCDATIGSNPEGDMKHTHEKEDTSNQKSSCVSDDENKANSQISPGSISLSLFQPLNTVDGGDSVTKNSNHDTVFDFDNDVNEANGAQVKPRAGPGRKKQNVKAGKKCDGAKTSEEGKGNTSLVQSGKDPGATQGPQKKKPGRKKKSELVGKDGTANDSKAKTNKSVKNVNKETGERVKRKYVKKADKIAKIDSEVKQTPKKGRKPKQNALKEEPKKSKESTEVINETKETVNEDSKNKDRTGANIKTHHETDKQNNKTTVAPNSSVVKSQAPGVDDTNIVETTDISQVSSPSTPLYGQTPKVTESNQGLPVSPNPECADNSVMDKNAICEPLFKTISEKVYTKETDSGLPIGQPNDVSDDSVNLTKLSEVTACDYRPPNGVNSNSNSNDELDAKLVIDESNTNENTYPSNGTNKDSESYINGGELTQLYPIQDVVHGIAEFQSRSPVSQVNPMGTVYGGQTDANLDQPLDLTSNGRRDEYMKGKIFKTKMLKRTFPKGDLGLSQKDKYGSPPSNGLYPHAWT